MTAEAHETELSRASLPEIGRVDSRFQSYNIEMVEVMGGRFWKPYDQVDLGSADDAANAESAPAGMDPNLYEYRSPIDLTNPRLRALAAGLGPAYVRVSGTWANTAYLPAENEQPEGVPEGFSSVLTREQWAGVVDFANATDSEIVISMAISPGARDAAGTWEPEQARRILALTEAKGGKIAAAELFNEPNMPTMGGAPAGYDADAYGRDIAAFRRFIDEEAPDWLLLGPGSVGEAAGSGAMLTYGMDGYITTQQLLEASEAHAVEGAQPPSMIDRFSFHHYGAASMRCGGVGMPNTTEDAALDAAWFGRASDTLEFYARARDEHAPGAELWCTETGQTACGGDPWAKTFTDTFRYVDQLGRFARGGVTVHVHNTLAASDYALLDETDFTPRPSYWAALLWRRIMGETVLDAQAFAAPDVTVYAHSLAGADAAGSDAGVGADARVESGAGVGIAIVNASRDAAFSLPVGSAGERFTLSADSLDAQAVRLNGTELALDGDALPELAGEPFEPGTLELAPLTITFLRLP